MPLPAPTSRRSRITVPAATSDATESEMRVPACRFGCPAARSQTISATGANRSESAGVPFSLIQEPTHTACRRFLPLRGARRLAVRDRRTRRIAPADHYRPRHKRTCTPAAPLPDWIVGLAEFTGSGTPVREQIARHERAAAARSRECLAAFPHQLIAGPRALVPGAGVQHQEQTDACGVRQLDLKPVPVLAVRGDGFPDRFDRWCHAHSGNSGVPAPAPMIFLCFLASAPACIHGARQFDVAHARSPSIVRISSTVNGGSRRSATAWQFGQSGTRSRARSTTVPGSRTETGVVWSTSMKPIAAFPWRSPKSSPQARHLQPQVAMAAARLRRSRS